MEDIWLQGYFETKSDKIEIEIKTKLDVIPVFVTQIRWLVIAFGIVFFGAMIWYIIT